MYLGSCSLRQFLWHCHSYGATNILVFIKTQCVHEKGLVG